METCGSKLNEEVLTSMLARSYIEASCIHTDASLIELISTIRIANVDVAAEPKGFSLLHYVLGVPFFELDALIELVTSLVDNGLDLYQVAYEIYDVCVYRRPISGLQSPTTMAMRCSESFFCWRQVLIEKGHSLPSFVMKELQTSPLVTKGWTKDILLALFQYDFQPYPRSQLRWDSQFCRYCDEPIDFFREIPWECKLEMIKQGRISELRRLDRTASHVFTSDGDQMDIYSAGSDDGTTRQANAGNVRVAYPEQDDGASGSGEDESTVSETASMPLHWLWRTVCDWCEMDLESSFAEEGSEDEDDEDDEEEEEEEEEEGCNPKMPGSFDF